MRITATIPTHDTPVEFRVNGELIDTMLPGTDSITFEAEESASIRFDATSVVWEKVLGDSIPLAKPDKIRQEDVKLLLL